MKFTEFRKLVEEYKNLIYKNKEKEAQEILKKIDPQNLGLKRFFVVKKYRLEKVLDEYCESNKYKLRYSMENVTNRSYDFIIKINEEYFKLKCLTKKSIGYINLKCLYNNVEENDGLNLLIEKHPQIVNSLWNIVKVTNNEQKHRKIVSLIMKIGNNENQLKYVDKEKSMIIQLIEQLKEKKKEVENSLEDIEVEGEKYEF